MDQVEVFGSPGPCGGKRRKREIRDAKARQNPLRNPAGAQGSTEPNCVVVVG